MRSGVKKSEEFTFTNKVFKPADIRRIAKVVYREYIERIREIDEADARSKQEHEAAGNKWEYTSSIDRPRMTFTLHAGDTQYESNDLSVIDGDYLDSSRIDQVEFSFNDEYSSITGGYIMGHLAHSIVSRSHNNSFRVRGYDERWISGVVKTLQDAVEAAENQKPWPRKLSLLAPVFAALSVAWMFANVVAIVWAAVDPEIDVDLLTRLILTPWFTMLTIFPAMMYFPEKLRALWPQVELATGPAHARTEELKRRQLWQWISVVVVPGALGIIIAVLS